MHNSWRVTNFISYELLQNYFETMNPRKLCSLKDFRIEYFYDRNNMQMLKDSKWYILS